MEEMSKRRHERAQSRVKQTDTYGAQPSTGRRQNENEDRKDISRIAYIRVQAKRSM